VNEQETKGWGAMQKPVNDASDPVFSGAHVTFRTQADVADIQAGCRAVGLPILDIKGGRRYGGIADEEGHVEYDVLGGEYVVKCYAAEITAEDVAAVVQAAKDYERENPGALAPAPMVEGQ
jgi:hypothetical protein